MYKRNFCSTRASPMAFFEFRNFIVLVSPYSFWTGLQYEQNGPHSRSGRPFCGKKNEKQSRETGGIELSCIKIKADGWNRTQLCEEADIKFGSQKCKFVISIKTKLPPLDLFWEQFHIMPISLTDRSARRSQNCSVPAPNKNRFRILEPIWDYFFSKIQQSKRF